MSLSYDTTSRNDLMNVETTNIGSLGLIKLYAGSVPANVGASLGAAVLLGTLTCASAFAAAASGGVLTANAIGPDSSADATGTATFFRITDSSGNAKIQGTAGTSGTDLILNTASIVAGAQISISSLTITEGNP